MDVTGDCQPDLIIFNQNQELEVWVYKTKALKQIPIPDTFKKIDGLKGLSISDISKICIILDYDGSSDLILAFETSIHIHLNKDQVGAED